MRVVANLKWEPRAELCAQCMPTDEQFSQLPRLVSEIEEFVIADGRSGVTLDDVMLYFNTLPN